MRMTISMDDVTSDRAIRLLTALEVADLLHDQTVTLDSDEPLPEASQFETPEMAEMDPLASIRAELDYEQRELPFGEEEQVEDVVDYVEVTSPDAADLDLFIDDFMGIRLQDALDAWVQGRINTHTGLPLPLPLIGDLSLDNLMTIAEAGEALGADYHILYHRMKKGVLTAYFSLREHQTFVTREQVAIMRLAYYIKEQTGGKFITKRLLEEATRAFLAAFPQYTLSFRYQTKAA